MFWKFKGERVKSNNWDVKGESYAKVVMYCDTGSNFSIPFNIWWHALMVDFIIIWIAGFFIQFHQFEIQSKPISMGTARIESGNVYIYSSLYCDALCISAHKGDRACEAALFLCLVIFRFDIAVVTQIKVGFLTA